MIAICKDPAGPWGCAGPGWVAWIGSRASPRATMTVVEEYEGGCGDLVVNKAMLKHECDAVRRGNLSCLGSFHAPRVGCNVGSFLEPHFYSLECIVLVRLYRLYPRTRLYLSGRADAHSHHLWKCHKLKGPSLYHMSALGGWG